MSRTSQVRSTIVAKRAVCRLCLKNHEYQMCVFISSETFGLSIGTAMRDLLHIEPVEGDGLPGTVCRHCVTKLVEFSAFKEMCIKSANLLGSCVFSNRIQGHRKESEGPVGSTDNGECISDQEIDEDGFQVTAVFIPVSDILPGEDMQNVKVEMEARNTVAEDVKDIEGIFLEQGDSAALTDPLAVEDLHVGVKDDSTSMKEEMENRLESSGGEYHMEAMSSDDSTEFEVVNLADKRNNTGVTLRKRKKQNLIRTKQVEVSTANAIPRYSIQGLASCEESTGMDDSTLSSVNPLQWTNGNVSQKLEDQMVDEVLHPKRCTRSSACLDDTSHLKSEPSQSTLPEVSVIVDEEYECHYCGVRYVDRNRLAVHIRSHVSEMTLLSHREPEKSPLPRGRMLKNLRPLTRNPGEGEVQKEPSRRQRKHCGVRRFKCEFCGKGFYMKYHLERHTNIHTRMEIFKCDICGREFNVKTNLMAHLWVHRVKKPFKCDSCGKGFPSPYYLQRHMRIHSSTKRFKCALCEKRFHDKRGFELHLKTHDDKRERYKCETCGKEFYYKNHYTRHLNAQLGIKRFKCDVCGKGFQEKSGLKAHLRIHSDVKPFQCDICGKRFRHKSGFVGHAAVHTGEKPYQCKICGQVFRWRSNYYFHTSILHSGKTPYKCDTCGKEFKWKACLFGHVQLHNRQKKRRHDV